MARRREAAATVGPEEGLLRLVGRAGAAVGRAQALHLVDGIGIGLRVQRRWRRSPELVARGQCERRYVGPLRIGGH